MSIYGKCPHCGRMERELFNDASHIRHHDFDFRFCVGCGTQFPEWEILIGRYECAGTWWKPWTWTRVFVAAPSSAAPQDAGKP